MSVVGDVNGDGIVDVRDYGVWRQHFGATGCSDPADVNADCTVDIRDYGIWRQNFGWAAERRVRLAARGPAAPARPAYPTTRQSVPR